MIESLKFGIAIGALIGMILGACLTRADLTRVCARDGHVTVWNTEMTCRKEEV